MRGGAAVNRQVATELRIGEAGPDSGAGPSHARRFDIRFADTGAGAAVAVELDPQWRDVRADFVPHALSRAFFSTLFAERPDRVVIEQVSSASLECARIAAALEFPVAIRIPDARQLAQIDEDAWRWLGATLAAADVLYGDANSADEQALRERAPGLRPVLPAVPADFQGTRAAPAGFGYEVYAVQRRDHRLLYEMQAPLVAHFADCARVLDLGCGTGVFLEALTCAGHAAVGVERNGFSARYAKSLGHTVRCDDALASLEAGQEAWDGIYCSHFVEHLPFEVVDRLIAAVARNLRLQGVALFVFPDPESIRSQLLGFWRDPEHVRFYHPELVATLAERYGLVVEYDSQQLPGRRVVPFAMEPPPRPQEIPAAADGWRGRLLRALGGVPQSCLQAADARIERLERAVDQLWAVNQTWAWEDNAVLRFRRKGSAQ